MSEHPSRAASVRRYVFYDEKRPSRAWMPALDAINERFCQHLRSALAQTFQPVVMVTTPRPIQLVSHTELGSKLTIPAHLTFAMLQPLRGSILLAQDAALVSWMVECRFGGDGRFPVSAARKDFSPFELNSAGRLALTILDQIALSWRAIVELEPLITGHSRDVNAVAIARSSEQVIVSVFDVRIGKGGGKLTLCIPYPMLEPLHDRLVGEPCEKVEHDQDWEQALRASMGRATLTLRVELAKLQVTFGDLLALRPGSVFDIERPEAVTVEAQGLPLFRGRWGRRGGKIGVRIEETLRPGDAAPPPPTNGGNSDDRS